jgi:predicted O-methyltransferase YrrM
MLVTNFNLKYRLYTIVTAAYQLLDVGRIHPVRERELRALKASVDYIEANMPEAMGFKTQRELITYALTQIKEQGHLLELGVFRGGTARFMAKRIGGRQLHGFDSFEGLPERWSGFDLGKGALDMRGKLPSVPDNVILHKGWFSDTLPEWSRKNPGPIAFMHIDCDIYSSTVDILRELADQIGPGTVILFDEYFNYPNWENHEYKAWKAFVESRGVTYTYLGFARQQVALRVDSVRGSP